MMMRRRIGTGRSDDQLTVYLPCSPLCSPSSKILLHCILRMQRVIQLTAPYGVMDGARVFSCRR
jgi:hypothetical protein